MTESSSTHSARSDLTVIIIAKNERKNIRSIVTAWKTIAPVLVVDSFSWDNTLEEAQSQGAEVISQEWLGFGAQKKFAVSMAQTEWVLSIDADEWPDEDLRNTLLNLSLTDPKIGYLIARDTYFLGKRVRYSGWSQDFVLRLFYKRYGDFDSRIVHEKVIHQGQLRKLPGKLIHHSYINQSEVLRKTVRYARLSSQQFQIDKKRKPTTLRRILAPSWSFFKILILKAGILDGITGLKIAIMKYNETRRKYQLLARQCANNSQR